MINKLANIGFLRGSSDSKEVTYKKFVAWAEWLSRNYFMSKDYRQAVSESQIKEMREVYQVI